MKINNPFNGKEVWVYDIETYPNFFQALFFNGERGVEFLSGQNLASFVCDKNKILVGYNSLGFDDMVIRAILDGTVKNEKGAFDFAQWIINHNRETERQTFNKFRYAKKHWYKSADLSIFFQDDESGRAKSSLKDLAIRLGWKKIQNHPYHFTSHLTAAQMDEVREYCKNDVLITAKLWNALSDRFELRIALEEKYNVDVFECSNAQISEKILATEYSRITKVDQNQLRRMSTRRQKISLSEIIPANICFKDTGLQRVLNELKEITILADSDGKFDRSEIKRVIDYAGIQLDLGSGGIHSKDKAGTFEASETEKIIDADVTSFYPSIIINNGIHPGHLTSQWTNILKSLRDLRVEAKDQNDELTSEALKIVINSAYGKAGNKYSFMHDPQLLLSTTVTGQLVILTLIEKIHECGCKVISANTDGVTAIVPDYLEEKYYAVCQSWVEESGYNLEFANYQKYVRNDVNNYIAIYESGKAKKKGAFDQGNLFKKNDGNIIPKSIEEFVKFGTPVEQTIRQNSNILDFCYSYKATKNFKVLYQDAQQQKTNRFYRSKQGHALIRERVAGITKTSKIGDKAQVSNAEKVVLCNDLVEELPTDIDYDFYIQKAKEILYRTIASQKAKVIQKLGLCPIPKQYKRNPRKSKLDEIKSDWDFGSYHGVGCYTGNAAGVVAFDIDQPEYLKIQHLLEDTLVVWRGIGSREQVLAGKKRGTVLYKCKDETLKNQGKPFVDKHGFELLYGKTVQLWGFHPDGEEYTYDGELAEIPKELHLWVYDNTKKKRKSRKKKLCTQTGDMFWEQETKPVIEVGYAGDDNTYTRFEKTITAFLPKFDMIPDDRSKFDYHVRGHCPFADEHTGGVSNQGEFDVWLYKENEEDTDYKIGCGCFHESCATSRAEFQKHLRSNWRGQVEEIRQDNLSTIEIPEVVNDLFGHLTSKERIVLIESPTGSGKSHNSALAFLEALKAGENVCYVAANKTEVTQFSEYLLEMGNCQELEDICVSNFTTR